MHSNPLVNFMRSYGPYAASDAQYDEHVQLEARKHGVLEFRLKAPLVEKIGLSLLGDNPTNVVLTGTAGDGKTYHIRQVAQRHLNVRPEEWPGNDLVLNFKIANGRELRIIRDLSELSESVKEEEIRRITRSLLGQDTQAVYLVAANDGQLLEMWRNGSTPQEQAVYRQLSTMLRTESEEDEKGSLRLRMYNLSKRTSPDIVDEAINQILKHPMWDSGCQGCELLQGGISCPIRTNRDLLKGGVSDEGQVFRSRLRDLVALATANGQHIPLRQVLTLIVNIVLGDSEDHDSPLLSCEKARQRVHENGFRRTNPYDNVVGANLSEETRARYTVFSTLENFGIGLETTNQFDEFLLQRTPESIVEQLERVDPVYGEALFGKLRSEYVRGARNDLLDVSEFARAMASQRRRLFFQLPEGTFHELESCWFLTVFHRGGDYLTFTRALRTKTSKDLTRKFTGLMVRGLNRAQTGMMASDTDVLWLSSAVGKSDDTTGKICTTGEIRQIQWIGFHYYPGYDEKHNRPHIQVAASDRITSGRHLKSLEVTPLLFEYLICVASGSLPSSFSRQCHQEVMQFATMLRQEIARMLEHELPTLKTVQILSLDINGKMRCDGIRVAEQ